MCILQGVPVRIEPGISHFVYGQLMPAKVQPYTQPGTLKAGHERPRALTTMDDVHTGAHAFMWTQGTGSVYLYKYFHECTALLHMCPGILNRPVETRSHTQYRKEWYNTHFGGLQSVHPGGSLNIDTRVLFLFLCVSCRKQLTQL